MPEKIYVRFDYEEAIGSKKDLLLIQSDLIQIAKSLKNYKRIRNKELRLKAKLKTQSNAFVKIIKSLQSGLPDSQQKEFSKVPAKSKKKQPSKVSAQEEKEDSNLEFQLQEIQDRLRALE